MSFQVSIRTKVAFMVAGFVLLLLMATTPNPDAVRRYLSAQGYREVRVGDRSSNCGKGRRQFDFHARAADGRMVDGHVCMSDLGSFRHDLHAK
jgi:hypothetical protein